MITENPISGMEAGEMGTYVINPIPSVIVRKIRPIAHSRSLERDVIKPKRR